ncbi:hypothetical protein A2763_02325 [Candidatus Kaiserbacteria bacterium RIFCSPHIGHO2_01_FULL_54_36]|uniref:DUF5666 domain-containing protein n=1 Tax=Candidatus Kaiserbacteria bacterium RIFCSPHIGHO2_01_FULL_54_36 TaxID=1798482 RepID=A0A1F6CNR1_9BACT|nr:MAG: hypothetical protein A2763_02325 [Candidatus Kaiserbacteria bacterium RIFCSPHIGHO2_01_FULL_54_36]OGG75995.1 MAG: hypothetical protein A3A41_03430 [Candidatus Kaiserbacteria bacterium RIFCSPLOWO2_01_FULL_54_22]
MKKSNKVNKYLLASGAAALALLVALPVLADSDREDRLLRVKENFGFGAMVKLFDNDNDGNSGRENRDRNNRDGRKGDNGASAQALSSLNSVKSSAAIAGHITAINGTQITVQSANGTIYTVDASNTGFAGNLGAAVIGDLRVGDRVVVRGELNGTVMTAKKIHDFSLMQRTILNVVGAAGAGVVSSIDGQTFTIHPISKLATTTVTTDATTVFRVNGVATTSDALDVGSRVIVFGTSTSDTSITASFVSILNHSFGWFKHFFLFR